MTIKEVNDIFTEYAYEFLKRVLEKQLDFERRVTNGKTVETSH